MMDVVGLAQSCSMAFANLIALKLIPALPVSTVTIAFQTMIHTLKIDYVVVTKNLLFWLHE